MGLRLGSISRIACSSGLASLLLAVPACGGDDDPCGALARLCADEGRPVAVGLRVEDAVFVDLDGDGEDEAVALSVSGQQVGLAGARGRIALQLFGEQPVGLAALPGEVAVAMQKPPGIAIFSMDGAGQLERRRDIPLSMQPTALRGADLSGDGAPELIAGLVALDERGPGTGQVAVIDPRTGAVRTFAAGTHPYALDVGDLDGDGLLEVVAVDLRGELHSVDVGRGLEVRPIDAEPSEEFVAGLAIADLDADARPDLARLISVAEGKSYVCALEVAYGVGPYQFGPWTRLAKAPNAQLVELGIGDVDDDGDVDLLISPSVGYAALVLATGPRTWAEARAVSAGAERGRSMFSRADARGRVDLVTHGGAAIYRHTDQPTAPRAELVRDEALLGSDLLRVADADGDGRYDLVVADAAQTHVWLLGDDGPRRVTVADARLDAVEFADIDGDRHPDLIGLSAGALFVRRTGK